MPQAVPIIGNIALNLAIGVGASVLSGVVSGALTQKVTTSKGLSFDLAVGATTKVSAIFGRGRAKGLLVYANEYGSDNEYLQLVIVCGRGEHHALEKFLVDGTVRTLSGSNADARGFVVDDFTVSGTPHMWVKYYTGAAGQAADPELITNANPSARWGSAHKLTGAAYMIVTLRYSADLFGTSLPLFGSVWRGLKLFDRRDPAQTWGDPSTYTWTENPAVIADNWRLGIWVNGVRLLGMGYPMFANDAAGFIAAANVCDETLTYPETGRTLSRYTFGREVSDDEERLAVLEELEASWSGSSFKRGGAYVPLPAQQLTSAMTLTDDDRLIGYPVLSDRKGEVSGKKTAWLGQFVSADNDYQITPYETRINAALETKIGGRRSVTLDQPYEQEQERAQMRAEIALRRANFPGTRTETFGPKALVLELGDLVTRTCDWGATPMMVVGRTVLEDRTGVTLTFQEWNNAIVPASGDSFVSLPADAGTSPASPNRIVTVSGFSATAVDRTGGGATHPAVRVSWTAIADETVDQVIVRYWPSAGSEATDATDVPLSKFAAGSVLSGFLPETSYKLKATIVTTPPRATVWTSVTTLTTGAELAAGVGPGAVSLSSLDQELANAVGLVTGSGDGSLSTIIDDLKERLNALAGVTTDNITLSYDVRGTLSALVATETQARVSGDAALASSITDVAAAAENLFADGLIKIVSTVDTVGSIATNTITFKSLVEAGGAEAFSALMLKAVGDGAGGIASADAYLTANTGLTGNFIRVGTAVSQIYFEL
ncbi:MAG: hypothetical protein GC202_14300 [Alphaproteobacteria bacterium]|nr:hypothetical protein [Alphaproteobacteria bacterium]